MGLFTKKCASCDADIIWSITMSGKAVPLDAKPEKRLVYQDLERTRVAVEDTYTSHFATCPNAGQHRKPKA